MPVLTVITYNVRSCVGKDGKASPSRIADVIAHFNADIVALQELDVRLSRTGLHDQARLIAERLNMEFHFLPSFRMEEGEYGNAILSRHPVRLVKAGELPTLAGRPDIERRGALWVEIAANGVRLQFITTHLGLNGIERSVQADVLLGKDWIRNEACRPPVVVCGDFNAIPLSKVYQRFRKVLLDAARGLPGRQKNTYPSGCPLVRIDYVFASTDLEIVDVDVPWTPMTASASDHLPLVVTISLPDAHGGNHEADPHA